ncbi:MAG: peptidoglycan DD-metalloendopeptidase family protein [Chitinophagales bacterium]
MALKKPDWSKWREKLKDVYRFQIVDEKHYDVKLVLELNRLNVLVVGGLLLAFFTFINFLFISFTPLKQYVPGYGTSSGRSEVINMNIKTQELERKLNAHQKYVQNLQNILNNKVVVDAVTTPLKKSKMDSGILSLKTTDEAEFVKKMEKGLQNAELMESVRDTKTSIFSNLELQKPVSGKIISPFDPDKSAGTTLEAGANEAVKAVLSGNVIFTGSSPTDGAFIAVQAENQLVYILKNNNQVLKKTGNFVQMGETIANAGKINPSGKYGSVLELWYKGQPIDPAKFLK